MRWQRRRKRGPNRGAGQDYHHHYAHWPRDSGDGDPVAVLRKALVSLAQQIVEDQAEIEALTRQIHERALRAWVQHGVES